MPADRVCLWRLGRLRLWLARAEKEWAYANENANDPEVLDASFVPHDVVPEGLEWHHHAFEHAPEQFELWPAVPPRPVVVRADRPVTIPAHESAQFFACIPVWVELWVGGPERDEQLKLATVTTRALSNTWFGNHANGELCYSLRFAASRQLDELNRHPHHIICPIVLENHSEEALEFHKLCLRTKHLAVYSGHEHFWSNVVRIRYAGKSREARVTYESGVPSHEPNLRLVSKAYEPAERVFVGLTFKHAAASDFQAMGT
ncbi:MAG: DUF432 domain-containing protein [Verrucomicrobiota bacterium JB022]|nr:DUF432 domain-containing protein [Verrucomicrobiota bacterium JB022]